MGRGVAKIREMVAMVSSRFFWFGLAIFTIGCRLFRLYLATNGVHNLRQEDSQSYLSRVATSFVTLDNHKIDSAIHSVNGVFNLQCSSDGGGV